MRRFSIYISMLLYAALIFNSCSKDSDGPGTPDPDPPGPEPSTLTLPKKEMRGAWIATVWALDWPRTSDFANTAYDAAVQKKSYTDMLDNLKSLGFNSVFVQVRGMGDAFYNSAYEPWSGNITGTRGKDPGYDVLKFMIDETHARGIEFHAWINPYRIATRAASGTAYPALHSAVKPEWVVDHEKIQIYNPALPEVRQRLADIVKDLITKYDVDGLHMDDYFYPDPSSAGTMVSDQPLYETMGTGFSTIQAWRRDNVDKAIELIHSTVVANKPQVVFSISPAASKTYNFNTLYADLEKWCKQGWVDILIPQLYQEIGNSSNDFQLNLSTWAQFSFSAKLVIGHALYRFGAAGNPAAFQSTQELVRQFDMTKRNAKAVGSVMYSARDVYANRIGVTDKLAELYSHKAVMPFAGREVAAPAAVPGNVKINGNELSWTAASGNVRSVVYHFSDLKAVGKVVAVTTDSKLNVTESGHYCVTSLNLDNLESKPTNTVEKK
ncbi:hypothetical protein FAZ15_05525 [Sphingobacterium olei]|uniref:Glycosyl hydrolase-like 10 domain-containing protein n=2 Tax=Sphingobacterium olei TaxID=2571155 RepID=A0A4U0P4L0_9SPHI|nr:hypothetical protein FAZ15_05525 [Sphingobacterium olei]